jgi:hypothetical protein
VIQSSEHNDMESLLEERARDIARLQRQVEELKSSLEAVLPPGRSPAGEKGPSLEQAKPSQPPAPPSGGHVNEMAQGSALHRNLPRRITVSLNDHVHQLLIERSMAEGRSVSNLAAFILETHLEHPHQHH